MYLPAGKRPISIYIERFEERILVRCSIGTLMVAQSEFFGTGREILARSVVDAFLNGDFDGTVP